MSKLVGADSTAATRLLTNIFVALKYSLLLKTLLSGCMDPLMGTDV